VVEKIKDYIEMDVIKKMMVKQTNLPDAPIIARN